ncbi:MAG: restriction endonuclease subunit S [Firmicutes bacterium]|nr:restriction endonuclease subunit S [Bacillota bacterium]
MVGANTQDIVGANCVRPQVGTETANDPSCQQGAWGVRWVSLEELCNFRGGYTPSKANKEFWTDGVVDWFRMEDLRMNGQRLSGSIQKINATAVKGKGLFAKESIIMATTATIGEYAMILVDSLANQQFTNLEIRKSYQNQMTAKFFFHYCFVLGNWCKQNTHMSGFASVDMEKFKKVKIPIPPLQVQHRIVSILDKFDALTTDLQQGLPAEIVARQKQYAYWRDRLLTFERV